MDKRPQNDKGEYLGMPYDWRPLDDEQRLDEEEQEPENHNIFIPKHYGWGYTINFKEIARRLHLFK
jgi:hypothetical protein